MESVPRKNHLRPSNKVSLTDAIWDNTRYALYIFILFGTLFGNIQANVLSFFIISFTIICLAEFFHRRNKLHLFLILMIDRILVVTVYYDSLFYAWFPAFSDQLYTMFLFMYDFDSIFYLVAAHVTFSSYVIKNKQPKFYTPVIVSLILYTVTILAPETKVMILIILNGIGIIATILFVYLAQSIFAFYDNRRLALISLYFIYSLFLLIDYVNSYQYHYEILNVSYAYPITLFLAACTIIAKQEFLQMIVKTSFIVFSMVLAGLLILIQPDHTIAITQHCSFILFLLLISKIVIDHRNAFKAQLRRYD